MILIHVFLIYFCFLVPTCVPQEVIPWGIRNSVGKSPFDPPYYMLENYTWGVNEGDDYNWPNGIVPYEFDNDTSQAGGNKTLCK